MHRIPEKRLTGKKRPEEEKVPEKGPRK